MSIQNKVALVTGASRGLGRAIAMQLAQAGAIVVGVSSSAAGASDTTSALNALGAKGRGLVMDVTKPEAIASAMEQIVAEYGAPNILVNNAGITRDNLLMRMSQDEWDQVIATNLTAAFRLCRACIREMVKARWGRIINITSVVAYCGNPGQTNYCASKGGLVSFSKSLAMEIASRNITVNCVAPGFIETDMTQKLSEEQRSALLASIPAKRIGTAEDVAHAVKFLAGEESSYITGTTIHVNGGMFNM